MTKQLPQEIQSAIDYLLAQCVSAEGSINITATEYNKLKADLATIIVSKFFVSQEQEDLHTLLGKAFIILINKKEKELSEEDRLMRQQLEGWLENNSMQIDFKQEQEDTLSDKIHKGLIKHYEEDTTPIEKIQELDLAKLNLPLRGSIDALYKKQKEIIGTVNSLISKQTNE